MASTWKTTIVGIFAAAFAVLAVTASPGRPSPLQPHKVSQRQIFPHSSLYAPAFLPTPLPPLAEEETPSFIAAAPVRERHRLTQPKKPVYHYTPIKPFSEEDLGDTYRGKKTRPSLAPQGRGLAGTRYGNRQLFEPINDGPQVHEYGNEEPSVVPKPIQPPTPIAPEPTVHVGPGVQLQVALPVHGEYAAAPLIPDPELAHIKEIRLGEAVGITGGIGATSAVLQRQNPAHAKYHFEYRVRDHQGEFGHAEAKDGPLTSGGYDVNLHKTHVQSVRYFVDSKEVPIYAHQFHHVL
ncbi:uncharacterized protein LOC124167197 [Ischnura elegans]|uniref:uncharacterized protein LOC124167197 n=1 Tax=Ischnura elegans TaxID=197161 RepID=UPI001ED8ACC2|nr:uncharacterized protein LOC124167197 [Ischnura elegans]